MARILPLPLPVASHLRSSCIVSSLPQIVDELVCNSIDAQATEVRIHVDISACYIKVEDDGLGIDRDDFALLGERHATSKLHCLEELEAGPQTLGFRGEGISSISDTGLVEVTSKLRGSPHTYRKILKNCKTLSMGLTGDQRDPGTTVIVKDIFYNQPVRKKQFLASSRKVLGSVKDHILRLALVHSKIWFIMVDIERQETVFDAKAAGSLSSRIRDIFGEESRNALRKIDFAKATYRLSGYISVQPKAFTKKALQYFYINRRFVHNTPLHKIINSWRTVQTENLASAAFVLNLGCPLADYDITFDTSKTLVEFKDWSPILSFVEEVLKQVWEVPEIIITASPRKRKRVVDSSAEDECSVVVPPVSRKSSRLDVVFGGVENVARPATDKRRSSSAPPFYRPRKRLIRSDCYEKMKVSEDIICNYKAQGENKEPPAEANEICKVRQNAVQPRPNAYASIQRPILEVGSGSLSGLSFVPGSISKEMLSGTRVLGQVDKKFIAAVANGTLLFVDQHAADERVRLEEFRKDILSAKEGHTKSLGNTPEEVNLTRLEHEMLTTYKTKAEHWGWHSISVFSRTNQRSFSTEVCTIVLTAVPCIKEVQLTGKDLLEYLHQLADTHGSSAPPPAVLRILNFKACRGAIMFGDRLLPSECEMLVNALAKTTLCFQCAHGRPTMVPIVNLKALRTHRWQLLIKNDRL